MQSHRQSFHRRSLFTAGIFAFSLALPNSAYAESNVDQTHSSDPDEVHWDYTGEGAPRNWGKLKSEFKACRLGEFQSPVDIKSTFSADLPGLTFDYKDAPLEILNNGHTVQVNFPEGGSVKVDDTTYNLLQLHFHTPSENTVNGKSYPMEMHLVHATKDGTLGVVGVMIEEGNSNAAAEKIWPHLPLHKADAITHADVTVNAAEFLPGDLRYHRFMGSLTTPPCTEGVNWHVLKSPISFSKAQIKKFQQAFEMNARPVQPLNSRMIVSE